jgi:ferrous iron transport protein A
LRRVVANDLQVGIHPAVIDEAYMEPESAAKEGAAPNDPCPLSNLADGEHGEIVQLTAGKEAVRRMVSLGLIPGTKVAVIQNPKYGALIVSVRDVRVAMGRGEAQKVQVKRFV